MLVGDVAGRVAILVDDLADTSNTITRAAKLLKKEGATKVYALLTHGLLSGDAIDRINASAIDKVVVTNSVPQDEHKKRCPKLEVLEIGTVFAEVRVLFWTVEKPAVGYAELSPGYSARPPWREHQCSISIRLTLDESWMNHLSVRSLGLSAFEIRSVLTP